MAGGKLPSPSSRPEPGVGGKEAEQLIRAPREGQLRPKHRDKHSGEGPAQSVCSQDGATEAIKGMETLFKEAEPNSSCFLSQHGGGERMNLSFKGKWAKKNANRPVSWAVNGGADSGKQDNGIASSCQSTGRGWSSPEMTSSLPTT